MLFYIKEGVFGTIKKTLIPHMSEDVPQYEWQFILVMSFTQLTMEKKGYRNHIGQYAEQ